MKTPMHRIDLVATNKTLIEEEKNRLLKEMNTISAEDPSYQLRVTALKDLADIQVAQKNAKKALNVILPALVNVLGIAMILFFEQEHVLKTKALSMVNRPRIG